MLKGKYRHIFMHCVLLEGMPEFVSDRPPLNPGLDADHSALEVLPHSVARDQRGHQHGWATLERGRGARMRSRRVVKPSLRRLQSSRRSAHSSPSDTWNDIGISSTTG